MSLNEQKGDMYPWCDLTWNPIGGRCSYNCCYCYMKRFPLGALTLREHFLDDNLGNGHTIFVGSSCDMWADEVPAHWIGQVLSRCRESSGNLYLYQTKNPRRFWHFVSAFPPKTMLGTTLETNREYGLSQAPTVWERVGWFSSALPFPKMVSIEPILDFDLDVFPHWIELTQPEFVSVGADSKGHGLPEPGREKVERLLVALGGFTEVKQKKNLERLLA